MKASKPSANYILLFLPVRAEVYFFSPSHRKGIERKFFASFAPLMSAANGR